MTTAQAAARGARLETAMNAAVAQVRAALPAIGAGDATAALEAAVPATMKGKGPARSLEELAAHMTAQTELHRHCAVPGHRCQATDHRA